MCNKSETITEIAKALVAFSGDVKAIEKDGTNPHFKSSYTTLDHMIDVTKPILQAHGLTVMQFPGGDGEKITMRTMILHESGEWIESEPLTLRPTKNDPQGAGSAITYARRYSYAAALSLSLGDDDDGNAASQQNATQGAQTSRQSNTPPRQPNANTGQSRPPQSAQGTNDNPNPITDNQKRMFFVKAKQAGFDLENDKETFWELLSAHLARMVFHVDHLQKSEFNDILKWFEEKAAEMPVG